MVADAQTCRPSVSAYQGSVPCSFTRSTSATMQASTLYRTPCSEKPSSFCQFRQPLRWSRMDVQHETSHSNDVLHRVCSLAAIWTPRMAVRSNHMYERCMHKRGTQIARCLVTTLSITHLPLVVPFLGPRTNSESAGRKKKFCRRTYQDPPDPSCNIRCMAQATVIDGSTVRSTGLRRRRSLQTVPLSCLCAPEANMSHLRLHADEPLHRLLMRCSHIS